MDEVGLVILIKESHRSEIDRMARALEAHGLKVRSTLPRFGTIVGSGDASLVERLRTVEGVQTVRRDQGVRLPPMDDDIPQ